jgi:hypothetical protein
LLVLDDSRPRKNQPDCGAEVWKRTPLRKGCVAVSATRSILHSLGREGEAIFGSQLRCWYSRRNAAVVRSAPL